MTHPNADLVRAMFEAHGRGDEARLRELLTEDVTVYHVRDGRISACWPHVVDGQDAFDRFWS